jgi:hypothetical protein
MSVPLNVEMGTSSEIERNTIISIASKQLQTVNWKQSNPNTKRR